MNTHHKSYPLQAQQMMNKGKRIRKSQNEGMNKRSASKKEEALKVVYISTPMKVTTSASKFREIVQELTGRESDVVSIMETSGGNDTWMVTDDDHHKADVHMMTTTSTTTDDDDDDRVRPLVLDHGSSPSSSSEDLVDHGGVFLRGQESNFGFFDDSASLFYDQIFQQFDLLGSY